MSVFNYKSPGLGSVGSYQVSGKPFLSGAIDVGSTPGDLVQIDFPSVTRWIVVTNHDTANDIRVAFSENGFNTNNYFTVSKDTNDYTNTMTHRLELKVSTMYLSGDSTNVDVIAGLTGISNVQISDNWSGSAGVG
jgi:hypothetical protein